MLKILQTLFFVTFFGFSVSATAQSKGDLTVALAQSKVVTQANGSETLIDAATVKPGETIEYRADYRNVGKSVIGKLEATLPIPQGTELVPGSAKPANAKASLDGVRFYNMPLKRRVKQANGKVTEELVPTSQYRFLRWYPGSLAAAQSTSYRVRVRVIDAATVNAAVANSQKLAQSR